MPNPCGKYAGRQIFVGALDGKPAFAYVVTGRSTDSKARYATPFLDAEWAIRIKPIDPNAPFDPFRHYQAIRIDGKTGVAIISNNQAAVDPIFEALLLSPPEEMYSVESLDGPPESPRTRKILAAIGPEYDNRKNPTPRIVGAVIPSDKQTLGILGITEHTDMAHAPAFPIDYDNLIWVATYNGPVEYERFDITRLFTGRTIIQPMAKKSAELAEELYDMTDYVDPTYGDLRVCVVAGVRNGNGPGGWDISTKNKHQIG